MYYVAAVLPVKQASLPADESRTDNLPADFFNNYTKYVTDMVAMLDQQPPSAFTPDLSKLDEIMQSIEVSKNQGFFSTEQRGPFCAHAAFLLVDKSGNLERSGSTHVHTSNGD